MFDSVENLINDVVSALYADPIYLVLGIVISGLLIFSLVKKLIRITMYISAIAILYVGYLYFTGEPVESVVSGVSKVKEDVKQVIEEQMNNIKPPSER